MILQAIAEDDRSSSSSRGSQPYVAARGEVPGLVAARRSPDPRRGVLIADESGGGVAPEPATPTTGPSLHSHPNSQLARSSLTTPSP